jgi:hypothetical protein
VGVGWFGEFLEDGGVEWEVGIGSGGGCELVVVLGVSAGDEKKQVADERDGFQSHGDEREYDQTEE